MKNKKVLIGVVISASVIFLLIFSFLCYWTIPFCVFKTTHTNISYNKTNNSIVVNRDSIKILQLTDQHVNGVLDMPITFSTMKKLIYKTEPDLIVFSGDIFSSGSSKKDVEKTISFIENLQLPWATVLGNHDDEVPYDLNELSDIIENAENSLYMKGNLTDFYGNYFYNLRFEDDKMFQFIFMDTRHDGFTEESVNFYSYAIESTKEINNGESLQNFTFFHIPIPEIHLAIEQYNNDSNIGCGQINEKPSSQVNDVGFFNKVLELNKTKALIFGHDHINNAKIKYQGVDLCYGTKTGPSSYNYNNIVGGTLYRLNSDGSYDYKDIFV